MGGHATIHGVDDTNTLDSGGRKWIPIKATPDGALHLAIDGETTTVSGTLSSFNLTVNNAQTDADADRYDDATGVKAFRFVFTEGATAATDVFMYGWSTSASDFSAIETKLASMATAITTPDGAAIAQVSSILAGLTTHWPVPATDWVLWDGTTRIKTIVPETTNATHITVTLEVIA